MGTVEDVENLIRPELEKRGYDLVETQYLRESGHWVLRLFIDRLDADSAKKADGVTLDDCAQVSDLAGEWVEASGLLRQAYHLEVSSPGINRTLRREKDFKRFCGQRAKISLHEPLSAQSKQKNFTGVIQGVQDGAVELVDVVSGRVLIPLASVSKAHLDLI